MIFILFSLLNSYKRNFSNQTLRSVFSRFAPSNMLKTRSASSHSFYFTCFRYAQAKKTNLKRADVRLLLSFNSKIFLSTRKLLLPAFLFPSVTLFLLFMRERLKLNFFLTLLAYKTVFIKQQQLCYSLCSDILLRSLCTSYTRYIYDVKKIF